MATTFLAALSTFGMDVRPILALGGAGTLAAGLAAQSTVTNLVAALSLVSWALRWPIRALQAQAPGGPAGARPALASPSLQPPPFTRTQYTSRPFVVGDRVQLRSLAGALVAAGMVTKARRGIRCKCMCVVMFVCGCVCGCVGGWRGVGWVCVGGGRGGGGGTAVATCQPGAGLYPRLSPSSLGALP